MKIIPLKVRIDGDPCLRRKSKKLDEVGVSERILIDAMIKTMYSVEGVGLAAPQVGINQRIFVFDIGEGPEVVINPEIIRKEGSVCLQEGCLSFPEVVINIERPQKIFVSYLDVNNQVINREFEDIASRVFLHEFDHLEGKLIIDYASKKEKDSFQEQLQRIHEIQKEQ